MSSSIAATRPAVSASWALNESAKDVVSISRGILHAATTDNVQPLALAAAEAFGTTIAIAQRTLMIVEQAASRRGTSAVLEFLQAQVGWSAHDSTSQLAKSDGGLRFLGLVAALNTAGDSFQCAQILESLLRDTAGRDQMLPTIGQLKDLASAVAPKLWKTGFADRVVGAERLLMGLIKDVPFSLRTTRGWVISGSEQIARLVTAFSLLDRKRELGPGSHGDQNIHLFVTTTGAYSWIYAFIDWCTGVPPCVVTAEGEQLLPQSVPSRVTLVCHETSNFAICDLRLELFQEIGHPRELLHLSKAPVKPGNGFLSVRGFGRRSMCIGVLPDDFEGVAVEIAVGYILSTIRIGATTDVPEGFKQYGVQVLPPFRNIGTAYEAYMGERMPSLDGLLQARPPLMTLPTFSSQTEYRRRMCSCSDCIGDFINPGGLKNCRMWTLNRWVARICLNILAIALFCDLNDTEILVDSTCQFDTAALVDNPDNRLVEFCSHPSQSCIISPGEIFKRAVDLLGISYDRTKMSYILAGAAGGQVMYLAVLDAPRLDGSNIFMINCVAGQLLHNNEKHTLIRGGRMTAFEEPKWLRDSVDRPRNMMPSCNNKITWIVSQRRECLSLSSVLGRSTANPAIVLSLWEHVLYIERCPHESNAALEIPDHAAVYVIPPVSRSTLLRNRVQVVAVAGNQQQRFFALAQTGAGKVVVRGNACLACCLSICRNANFEAIIL